MSNILAYFIAFIVLMIMTIILYFTVGFTNEKEANKVLYQAGYSNIKITGYKLFSCAKDDWYHTGFEAISPAHIKTSGTVCSGLLFKNSTIRFD
jgi:hypothetical protein